MAKEDIVGGLKNAVEKGESLESAIQSFINAGYNSAEVREAGQMLGFGSLNVGSGTPNQNAPGAPSQQVNQSRQSINFQEQTKPKSRKWLIILIIILMILAVILGVTLLFKDKIIEFVSKLFG